MRKIVALCIALISISVAHSSPLITSPNVNSYFVPTLSLPVLNNPTQNLIQPIQIHLPPKQLKYGKHNNDSLFDIFRNMDTSILNSSDSAAIRIYLISQNQLIANHIAAKYPKLNPSDTFAIHDPKFIYAGIVLAILEWNGMEGFDADARVIPDWLRCILDVVAGYFDVRWLIRSLGQFTIGSVMETLGFIAKKYLGWLGAGVLIYDVITNCLD